MSNKTAPILLAVVLGAVGLTPVFLKSFGDKPEVANVGLGKTGTATASNITAQSDDITKAGYSLGYMMGTNVAQSAKDLKQEDIIKGLQDGQAGKQAVLTREQMEQAVMAYQERQMKEMLDGNLAKGQQFLAENGKKAGVKTTASGLQYEVLKEGNATKPKATDRVSVKYEGKLLNGQVFDSTEKSGGQPVEFPLNQVIAGWTEGLQLMGEGAKYRFYIPSNLAYGEQGAPQGGIEPNSVLIFDVELLKVNPPQSEAQKQAQMSDNPDIQAQLRQLEAQMQQAQTASQPAH
ncbi:FKBP-type peptidyl-prolyl cis-trans isomerase [Faucicola mancuniensis]|uniref:FKBP-type peptidyl-prolyl cis-trans isomerase n=1 Tax=Faucicola mancuniensis TaxID=1309795 RepID=UPI0039774F1B